MPHKRRRSAAEAPGRRRAGRFRGPSGRRPAGLPVTVHRSSRPCLFTARHHCISLHRPAAAGREIESPASSCRHTFALPAAADAGGGGGGQGHSAARQGVARRLLMHFCSFLGPYVNSCGAGTFRGTSRSRSARPTAPAGPSSTAAAPSSSCDAGAPPPAPPSRLRARTQPAPSLPSSSCSSAATRMKKMALSSSPQTLREGLRVRMLCNIYVISMYYIYIYICI